MIERDQARPAGPGGGVFSLSFAGLPVPVWGAFLSCLCMIVGWQWDICWHRSIGRDTVWTPPHIAIYLALALAFVYNAWLVFEQTFGRYRDVAAIRVFGFRAPTGSFVTLCGIFLQFIGILFDIWWHEVYGVDTAVFSPPHWTIAYGVALFYVGQLILVVLYRNLEGTEQEARSRWIVLGIASIVLAGPGIGIEGLHGPLGVRAHAFVHTSSFIYPLLLVAVHVILKWRWAATICSGLYLALAIGIMQVFQLFPASPQFGPVHHQIAHFLPPPFPLPLIVPAILIDVVLRKRGSKGSLGDVVLLGVLFVVSFTVVNWLLSALLVSPWGDNRFFAGGFPGSVFEEGYRPFVSMGRDLASLGSILLGILLASLAARLGIAIGQWLRGLAR